MGKYQISGGVRQSALKIVVYGPEGIGKTTFSACFPNPVFIDTEGSTKFFDIKRFPDPSSWEMLLDEVQDVVDNPTLCDTLVVDTLDWAERLCIKEVCESNRKKGIEDFGYGKGYTYTYEAFAKLLHKLDDVSNNGVNVVVNAHAMLRKFEQPDEMGSYDRWELKLINSPKANICGMVKEWADMVIFANYKTYVVAADKDGKKHKAQGGKRIMNMNHNPCWDAKNRFGFMDEMDFNYNDISIVVKTRKQLGFASNQTVRETVPSSAPVPEIKSSLDGIVEDSEPSDPATNNSNESEYIPKVLEDLMNADGITADEIKGAVASMGYYPIDMPIASYGDDFINGCIAAQWNDFVGFVKSRRNTDNDLPF